MQKAAEPDTHGQNSDTTAHQGRRNLIVGAVAVAAVAVVASGVYAATRTHPGSRAASAGTSASNPTSSSPTVATSTAPRTPLRYPVNGGQIPAGTYWLRVGHAGNHTPIRADINLGLDWQDGNFPVLTDLRGKWGGMAVYHPLALAAGNGCVNAATNTSVAKNPGQLAHQLTQLPRSTILQQPRPVQAFGRHAVHLRLRIDSSCGRGVYRVAETVLGGQGTSYGPTPKDVVVDFWAVNVGGTPVVVETWHQTGANNSLVNEVAHTERSVKIVTSS